MQTSKINATSHMCRSSKKHPPTRLASTYKLTTNNLTGSVFECDAIFAWKCLNCTKCE